MGLTMYTTVKHVLTLIPGQAGRLPHTIRVKHCRSPRSTTVALQQEYRVPHRRCQAGTIMAPTHPLPKVLPTLSADPSPPPITYCVLLSAPVDHAGTGTHRHSVQRIVRPLRGCCQLIRTPPQQIRYPMHCFCAVCCLLWTSGEFGYNTDHEAQLPCHANKRRCEPPHRDRRGRRNGKVHSAHGVLGGWKPTSKLDGKPVSVIP